MSEHFVAIDVETANADLASICQVGLATYRDGALVDEWKSYVDPEDYFDGMNVSVHGIDEDTVRGAPALPKLAERLYETMDNRIVICHTHFDRVATAKAFARYNLRSPQCTWLDSARVARRAWKEFAFSGFGLGNLCKWLGHEYAAHDALEDAKAAAVVMRAVIEHSGLALGDWLDRVERPMSGDCTSPKISRDGNPNGPLFGEVMVFTGTLCLPRAEAAARASRLGCKVDAGVTKRTTILVVGDADVRQIDPSLKTAKQRKAEQLVLSGKSIRVIGERDFAELLLANDPAT